MPSSLRWGLIAAVSALLVAATYLMISRGPALLVDLGSAVLGCF